MKSILEMLKEEDSIVGEIRNIEAQIKYYQALTEDTAHMEGVDYGQNVIALKTALKDARVRRTRIHEQIEKEFRYG